MLPPGWGYVDEPPLVPLLARLTGHLSASPWALRIRLPRRDTVCTRLGADYPRAWAAGGSRRRCVRGPMPSPRLPSLSGTCWSTTTVDLVVWPLTCLFVMRALLRRQRAWWIWAGVVVGLSAYNKLLVVLLVVALVAGVLLVGPRGCSAPVGWAPPCWLPRYSPCPICSTRRRTRGRS